MAYPGGFGEVEEGGHLVGVGDPQNGRDEVEAVDSGEGCGVGGRLVPVEQHGGAVARRGAGAQSPLGECLRHERAGPASAAENECGLR